MSNLEEFINNLKLKTKDYNALETIRYVYLTLGFRMSFDCLFTDKSQRSFIYNNCTNDLSKLENDFNNQIIICKSLCYLLEYILKSLGFNITTQEIYTSNPYKHTINRLKLENDTISLDLQQDLENIHFHRQTKYFKSLLTSLELKTIDQKIGYIKDNYFDYYLSLLKDKLKNINTLESKLDISLDFLNNYRHPKEGYIELRYAYKHMLTYLLEEYKEKLFFIDLKRNNNYTLCITLNKGSLKHIYYLINTNTLSYQKLTKEELLKTISFYESLNYIPGLNRHVIKLVK